MEAYGKFTPIEFSDEEEMLQQQQEELFPQQQTCLHQLPINRRKLFKQQCQKCNKFDTEEETSSSSSSSSSESSSSSSSESSSDSEIEEIGTQMKRTNLRAMKMRQEQQQRKWEKVVDLKGLRPQDVKVVLNPLNHVLVIKTKRGTTQFQQQDTFQDNVIRVIPLPRRICVQKLRVKATPTGELLIKAPFLFHGEQQTSTCNPLFQREGRLPTWVPIHVTYKGKQQDIFGSPLNKEQQLFNNFFNIPVRHTTKPYECTKQFEDEEDNVEEQLPYFQKQQQFTNKTYPTRFIIDEVTGKPILLLKVNTIGFRPQEIRVRLSKVTQQKVLIVEAGQRGEQMLPWEITPKQTVTPKFLRREFVLPHNVNVKKIFYQVERDGLLTIKVPIMMKLHNTMQQSQKKWEKALRI